MPKSPQARTAEVIVASWCNAQVPVPHSLFLEQSSLITDAATPREPATDAALMRQLALSDALPQDVAAQLLMECGR